MKSRLLFVLTLLTTSIFAAGCTLATVRTIEEDIAAKEGFNATRYVAGIWDTEFIPTLEENAVEISQLLGEIDADEDAATAAYGNRTSSGPFSFMTRGEVVILNVDRESRVGLAGLDIQPYDGEADVFLAVGPVLRGNALRDAVGFIAFNDFTNQVEFAQVSDALKERTDIDLISTLDFESMVGNTVEILGAFTLDDRNEIVIMPVKIQEVGQ